VSDGHECDPGWLRPDTDDPNVAWCERCGACLGSPGGMRDQTDFQQTSTETGTQWREAVRALGF
jgi:hypothetical protein